MNPDPGRDETEEERLDRVFADMLQELRIMQTGAQLLAAFLLTLPFQQAFRDIDDVQRTTYLVLVVLAGLTTALVLTPVAIHRRLSGDHVKDRVVRAAKLAVGAGLACLAVLICGTIFFVFDVVESRGLALVVAGVVAVVVVGLLGVLPAALTRDQEPTRR